MADSPLGGAAEPNAQGQAMISTATTFEMA
jgi:hypothetical protein